jgi:hypothetical protein
MTGYAEIDGVLMPWAERRGLHVYVGHRQNVVRSITIYVWMGPRHESTGHVWIDPINEMALIGIHAAAGNFRFDDAVPLAGLTSALDAACEKLAERKQRSESV